MEWGLTKLILSDEQLAAKVNAYIKENPDALRRSIIDECKTSHPRLKRLSKIGLIAKLPHPVLRADSARKARKNSIWGNFKLKGSLSSIRSE